MRLGLPSPSRRQLLIGLAGCLGLSFLLIALLSPPVWKLRHGPIEVERWPKSGPQLFSVGPG